MLIVGQPAPTFALPNQDNKTLLLADFRGKNVILYFYPKDDTPGCTREACDFRDQTAALAKIDTCVIGISRDSLSSHQKFKQKYHLPFPLLSDVEGTVCEAYGVLGEKIRFGRKYQGINRTTFLLDGQGIIRAIWQNVKVEGHVTEIVGMLKNYATA
jgi:peroxiredoxin Q/BCP